MSLRTVFKELYAAAEQRQTAARPGEALRVLKQGAEVTVRAQGRRRQVILSRRRVPVSEVEIKTFMRDGEIPDHAVRRDWPKTARGWCYVDFIWETPATLWEA